MKTYINMKCFFIAASTAYLVASCSGNGSLYDATGVFEATEVVVSAKAQGEIVRLRLEEGEQVTQGDTLGVIDYAQLSLKRSGLIANGASTASRTLDQNKQVAALKQQIANAEKEHARFSDLLKNNAATQKQVDDIGYQIEVLRQQLTATTEQLVSSNNSLARQGEGIDSQIAAVEKQIADAVIQSPVSGTILVKYAEQGEYAIPGRALFKVADLSEMSLRAYVSAPQMAALKIGQKAKVFVDYGENDCREYDGTLSWISEEAEFTPKTIQTKDERSNLVYAVKVSVKNDGTIKRGMYGDVRFGE